MLVGQNSTPDTKLERLLPFYDLALRKLLECEQTYPDVLLKGIQSIAFITAGETQSNRETRIFAACRVEKKNLMSFLLMISTTFLKLISLITSIVFSC